MAFADILNHQFMDIIEKNALKVIANERNQYNNIWQIIEQYAAKNKILISNKYILINQPNAKNNIYKKTYYLYTINPLCDANQLTNLIYQQMQSDINSHYTRLKTIKENEEFVIEYNLRQVATIYKIQKYKDIYKLIHPIQINKLLYIPSEIELIDIYHSLYDPSQYDTYDEMLKFEDQLFQQVSNRKEKGYLGGRIACPKYKKQIIEVLKVDLIMKWITKNQDIILIGPWVYDIQNNKSICPNHEKIQIISKFTADEVLEQIKYYAQQLTSFEITKKEQSLHIPKDFRTLRITYYLKIQTARGIVEKPFLDLFNCAEFEIIPAVLTKNILIGTKWVLLRFLFIDLWIVRIIKTIGYFSSDKLNKKIQYLWNIIEFFRNKSFKLTPIKDTYWIGVYKDMILDKKMQNLDNKSYYPYYPYAYYKQHHKFREI